MSERLEFPKGFLWGVATSAYQIEGDNSNSDWWEWEKMGKADNESGKACDYWNRWKQDHDLLSLLDCGSFRLGIEWARIEPEEGQFSDEAIEKYKEILIDLKKRNLKTQVTLWHWTSPIWFQKKYGFHKKDSIRLFSRYAEKVVEELGDYIDLYVTFNEPMVPLGQGYLARVFPPGKMNPFRFYNALENLAAAHCKVYIKIHSARPLAQVGITYLYNWYEAEGLGFVFKILNRIASWYRIDLLGKKLEGYQDFVGIDYYRLGKIKFNWHDLRMDSKNQKYFGFTIEENRDNVMKWISFPKGFYRVLKEANAKFKLPIYVTENGVPTSDGLDDQERINYINGHLQYLHKAIQEGVDIRGYNYWSLMDNLEWLYGYKPKFGLVEIDYTTLERKPRQSFYAYAKICKSNALDNEK